MLIHKLSYYCIFYFLLVIMSLSSSVVFSAGEPDLNYVERINNSEVRSLFKEKKYWAAMRKARELNLSSDEDIISKFFDRTIPRNIWQRSRPPLIRPINANYADRINNIEVRALFNEKKYMRAIKKARELGQNSDKAVVYEFVDDTLVHTSKEIHATNYSLKYVNKSPYVPGTLSSDISNLNAELPNESTTSIGDIKVYTKLVENKYAAIRGDLSYELSRDLDLDVVPPTYNDLIGTQYSLAIDEEYYINLDNAGGFSPSFENIHAYKQLKGFDYLTGQYNRNSGSIFVSKTDASILITDNNTSFYSQADQSDLAPAIYERDLLRSTNRLPVSSMANFFTDSEWSSFSQKDISYFSQWFNDRLIHVLVRDNINPRYFKVSKAEFLERIKLFKEKVIAERIPTELVPNIEAVSDEVAEEVFLLN